MHLSSASLLSGTRRSVFSPIRCATFRRIFSAVFVVAGVFAATALTGPSAMAQAEPPSHAMQEEAYPPHSARWKVFAAGLGTTAGFYAIAQPFAYGYSSTPGVKHLRIPIVGPWMALYDNVCVGGCNRYAYWVRNAAMVLDGLGQAGGIFIMLESLFIPTFDPPPVDDTTRRNGTKTKKPASQQPNEAPVQNLFLAPTPMGVGASGVGISVSGAF